MESSIDTNLLVVINIQLVSGLFLAAFLMMMVKRKRSQDPRRFHQRNDAKNTGTVCSGHIVEVIGKEIQACFNI